MRDIAYVSYALAELLDNEVTFCIIFVCVCVCRGAFTLPYIPFSVILSFYSDRYVISSPSHFFFL